MSVDRQPGIELAVTHREEVVRGANRCGSSELTLSTVSPEGKSVSHDRFKASLTLKHTRGTAGGTNKTEVTETHPV